MNCSNIPGRTIFSFHSVSSLGCCRKESLPASSTCTLLTYSSTCYLRVYKSIYLNMKYNSMQWNSYNHCNHLSITLDVMRRKRTTKSVTGSLIILSTYVAKMQIFISLNLKRRSTIKRYISNLFRRKFVLRTKLRLILTLLSIRMGRKN